MKIERTASYIIIIIIYIFIYLNGNFLPRGIIIIFIRNPIKLFTAQRPCGLSEMFSQIFLREANNILNMLFMYIFTYEIH